MDQKTLTDSICKFNSINQSIAQYSAPFILNFNKKNNCGNKLELFKKFLFLMELKNKYPSYSFFEVTKLFFCNFDFFYTPDE